MHDKLLIAPLIFHSYTEPFNIFVPLTLVSKVTLRHHLFISGRHNSNEIVEQEHVGNAYIENNAGVMFPVGAAFGISEMGKVTEHGIEEGTEGHGETGVVD